MQSEIFRERFFLLGLGGNENQANVRIKDLKKMYILVPLIPEQQRIAEILSTWDNAIELKELLIEEREKQKSR